MSDGRSGATPSCTRRIAHITARTTTQLLARPNLATRKVNSATRSERVSRASPKQRWGLSHERPLSAPGRPAHRHLRATRATSRTTPAPPTKSTTARSSSRAWAVRCPRVWCSATRPSAARHSTGLAGRPAWPRCARAGSTCWWWRASRASRAAWPTRPPCWTNAGVLPRGRCSCQLGSKRPPHSTIATSPSSNVVHQPGRSSAASSCTSSR